MTHNKFDSNGCFSCELCGKLTRRVDSNTPYCQACIKQMEQENEEEDEELEGVC